MENKHLYTRLLPYAEKYLKAMTSAEQARVVADIRDIERKGFASVYTKQLRGPIRELLVGNHRFSFFLLENMVYFVRGFRKKTTKTPRDEIAYAEKIYKLMRNV